METLDDCTSASREAYTLEITDNGNVLIEVLSESGALYALETFSQLFFSHSSSPKRLYTTLAPVKIQDCPSFGHRGVNLDISRNRMRPEDILRTLEAMARSKLNRLHLHAADSQSWPLEIPALPDLARRGAYDTEQIWTISDQKRIFEHGRALGIEVFLEFDMPGHTSSIAHAFPELITAAHEDDWSTYALEPPSGQLKLNSSKTQTFMTALFSDLLPRTRPYSGLIHFGGDEVNLQSYTLDETVGSAEPTVLQPLIQNLMDHAFTIAKKYSATPIVWQEMLLEWNLTIPQNALVQSWTTSHSLSDIVQKGHKALFGSNTHWYLDCGHGQFLDPDQARGNDTEVNPPYTDYCAPYKNWRMVYSYDPLADIPAHNRHLIMGGEVHLWSELTDSVTLDGILWPRVAAAAEVLWSGPGRLPSEDTTRRLAEMRERLVIAGVSSSMVQMEHCLRYKGSCKL